MLHTLKLLLPALIPSWNFFDIIVPSPRIQFSINSTQRDKNREWQLFRPHPQYISFGMMLKRMLWNPRWNESLFLMSCAERLLDYPTQHSEDEILIRITHDLVKDGRMVLEGMYLQFRLVLVKRVGQELVYESQSVALDTYIARVKHT
ncbi:MAG: hypothetical protein OEY52_08220 [Gammaproteobacteria bacterium]|nr:hypothetical protein [Gammaproteobacteria bacterium]